MYLAELELHGFKSFANKTKIKFDSGITAIVGPNGCGKSNIVDSIRWVLGEQRPSLLRSSAMSNVIFNGTAQKKALGMAEVSVTIENNKGILPSEFRDVTITRRLFRSGESEYLLNNTPCRLKDIIELFMDTGMGSNAYSVIELKMVEEILNDKNNDRRKLFEEAAGVTKYKEKRKQTFRKLEETKEDLQRVEDILVEIRKNTRSLQIQASKARRAKEYKEELHHLDLALARYEYDNIQKELKPLMERIVNAENEKEQSNRDFEQLERQENAARESLKVKEHRLAQAQQQAQQLQNTIRETDTTIKITGEKIVNEQNTIRQYEQDIYQSEEEINELRKSIKSGEKRLKEKEEERNDIAKDLEIAKETFEDVDYELREARQKLDTITEQYNQANRDLNEIQTKKVRIESRLENSDEDLERIDKQINNILSDIERLSEDEQKLNRKVEQAYTELEHAENQLENGRNQRERLSLEQNDLKDKLRSEQSRLDAAESEIVLLQNIANSHEAFPASVQYLLEQKNQFSHIAVLSDIFSTEEKYAVALESVLGGALNYLVVETVSDAQKAIELLKKNDKGKATVIPLELLTDQYQVDSGSLYEYVKGDDRYQNLKKLLLGQVNVVGNMDEGLAHSKQHPSATAVTLTGDVITSQHFLRSGSANENVGIRVGLKDKIEKLERKAIVIEDDIEVIKQKIQANEQQYQQFSLAKLQTRTKETEQLVRKLESQLSSFNARKAVYEKNVNELRERKEKLQSDQKQSGADLKLLDPEIDELNKNLKTLLTQQLEQKNDLQKIEQSRSRSQNRYNDIKLKHQHSENEVLNIKKDIERAEQGIKTIKERLTQRSENARRSKDRIIGHRNLIEEAEAELEELQSKKVQMDEALNDADTACAKERGRINQIEEELKDKRRKREVNMELLHHLNMAKTQFDMQSKNISDHVWEDYGILMDKITHSFDEDTDPKEAKERISSLKQKLKNIGEVNPLAIEEYEKEKERLDFYEQQIEDLIEAEQKLRDTIREINETAQERFNSTFEKVRVNFISVFNTLFDENDHCDLILEENEDDPLESKVEIIANPRGKRPSNISQLSGGEKTLTAIALLFAIYLVKPSPFCILDEVDAPLDDANIDRFAKILRRFSKDTQFLVITHNKQTMEKAEMMYGVTMPQIGVSQLVGVRMDNLPV
ncbi:MAG TPA: chromosome segregation protein SMC [Balneolales bacterium]|nr:chromosome segregation protein SMC [Balneolales bacterium]